MGPILVAICTYDRYPLLARTVAAALRQEAPQDWRILVVDNSPDAVRARQEAERLGGAPRLEYRLEPRPGVANARNVAFRAAEAMGAALLVFLDDDAVPHPGWLAALASAFEPDDVAAVGGRVDLEWVTLRPPWLHDLALAYLSEVNWGPARRELQPSEWLAGANLALRVSALTAINGFDAQLGRSGAGAMLLSNEESDLLRRLRLAGHRVLYEPAAVIDHLVHPDRLNRAWFRRRAAWQAVSDYMTDPAAARRRADGAWREIRHYTSRLLPWQRGLSSLERDVENPRVFMKQLHAIYLLTLKQLAGLSPESGPGGSARGDP